MVQKEADARQSSYNDWVIDHHTRGTGALHAITKPPQGWAPRPTGASPDGSPPTLQETVTALVKEWSGHWGLGGPISSRASSQEARVDWPGELGETPPRPTVEEVRKVTSSFKEGTGAPFDSLRHR
eukprot:7076851-Pyramimonas_sp.AAC.1